MTIAPSPQDQDLVELSAPVELAATLWPLAHGTGDPTIRFAADGVWRAMRLPDGVATLQLRQLGPATGHHGEVTVWLRLGGRGNPAGPVAGRPAAGAPGPGAPGRCRPRRAFRSLMSLVGGTPGFLF